MDSDLHLGFFKPSPPPASTEDAPKVRVCVFACVVGETAERWEC